MSREIRIAHFLVFITCALMCSANIQAQPDRLPPMPPPSPPPTVLALGSFTLVVDNLERAIAFYQDAIGLELESGPTKAVRDPDENRITATPGAVSRYAKFIVPNEYYDLKLVEYSGIARSAGKANHNDPGSSFLNFGMWDVARAFTTLRQAKAVTVGVEPIPAAATPGRMAGIWVRDPDGHLLEVMQGGWDPALKSLKGIKNIYRSHFGITMNDYRQALAFYRDLLGFDLTPGFPPMMAAGQYIPAKMLAKALGVPEQAMFTGVAGHCAGARCEMFEFRDAPRISFHPRIQDPGASYLSIWVSDIDALVRRAQTESIEFISVDAKTVDIPTHELTLVPQQDTAPPLPVRMSRQVMIRDPSGFPILLMQRTQ